MNTPETAIEPHAHLAPTPPMGWNSYTCFGITVREHEVLANARCMAAELAPFGWEYVVLDGMWYHDTGPLTGEEPWGAEPHPLDDYGRLLPNLRKFPSAAGGAGLKPLADAIHALGLKFGLHLMRGIPRRAVELNLPILGTSYRAGDIADTANPCTWFEGLYGVNMSHPGGQAYYDSVLKLFAEWQIDYLKVDDCGLPSYQSAEVEGIFRAVECSGRRIIMSLAASDEKSTFHAEHLKRHTHLWRVGVDLHDEWPQLHKLFDLLPLWMPHTGPDHWVDPDMLPLGVLHLRKMACDESDPHASNLTRDEQVTLMTLWCISRAPLMFAGDLTQLDDWTRSLITNEEVLAVNQSSRGNRELFRHHDLRAWVADGEQGRHVAFFNLGDTETITLDVPLSELGASRCRVRDLWLQKDLGWREEVLAISVPPRSSSLYTLTT